MNATLVLTVHEPAHGFTLVSLAGEVDETASDPINELWNQLLDGAEPPSIAVDLSQVTYFGSAGVAALLQGYRQASERDRSLVVTEASRAVQRVLEICGVEHLLHPDHGTRGGPC